MKKIIWLIIFAVLQLFFLIIQPHAGNITTGVMPMPFESKSVTVKSDIDHSGISVRLHPSSSKIIEKYLLPVELLITDPQGRVTGYDPIKDISFKDIPDSYYETVFMEDTESGDRGPPLMELEIPRPLAGDYQLQVIGTGTGAYDLDIQAVDPENNPTSGRFKNIPVNLAEIHKYNFYFAKTVGSEIQIYGGFDGGGQRPRDMNKFLSYSKPSDHQTNLPMGTITYGLMIFYDKAIIPATFKAEINNVDISSLFTPVPSSNQVVNLTLHMGRNNLVLSVDGNLPNRKATDTDRLVFIVK